MDELEFDQGIKIYLKYIFRVRISCGLGNSLIEDMWRACNVAFLLVRNRYKLAGRKI